MAATPSPGQPILSPPTPGTSASHPPMATAQIDVEPIIKLLDAVEAQGNLLFGRIKSALVVPYADEDAIADCMRLHELINQLEAQMKTNVLVQCSTEPPSAPIAQLNASYAITVSNLHEEREQIIKAASAARKQLTEGAQHAKRV